MHPNLTGDTIAAFRAATNGQPRLGPPKRFVRLFKPRFAQLVEAGQKTQTIRPVPVRVPYPGDVLSLRQWTGLPYRSKQRVLAETRIRQIKACQITEHGIVMQPPDGCLLQIVGTPLVSLTGEDADRFARADGFADWSEMRDWFKSEHGLPFEGIVIYW